MEQIQVVEHHLGSLVRNRLSLRRSLGVRLQNAVASIFGNAIYGSEHLESKRRRIRSLPDDTVVELVADKDSTGNPNIDYICDSACPYIELCSSGISPRPAMRARAGFFYHVLEAAEPDERERNKAACETIPIGLYRLDELVERARPYFNR